MPTDTTCSICNSVNVFFSKKRTVLVCEDCDCILPSVPVTPDLAVRLVARDIPPSQDAQDAERELMETFAQTCLRWHQGRMHKLQKLAEFIQSNIAVAPRLAVVAAGPGQGNSHCVKQWHELIAPEYPAIRIRYCALRRCYRTVGDGERRNGIRLAHRTADAHICGLSDARAWQSVHLATLPAGGELWTA